MLVLSRRIDETVRIADNIEIRVLYIGKNFTKLGITAPKNVPVHRGEVYDRIHKEKKE
jgi:carbon storage regulator